MQKKDEAARRRPDSNHNRSDSTRRASCVCALLKCSTRINFCGGSKSIQKIHSVAHTHTHDTLAACVCAVSCMWATSTATATAITERLSLPTCLTHKTCAYCCDCRCCCLHLHVPHCGCWPLMKSDKLLLFSRSSRSFPCYVCSSNTTDARHFSSF